MSEWTARAETAAETAASREIQRASLGEGESGLLAAMAP